MTSQLVTSHNKLKYSDPEYFDSCIIFLDSIPHGEA
jgi:hypothetical protein